jgi:hypothetical protein
MRGNVKIAMVARAGGSRAVVLERIAFLSGDVSRTPGFVS